MIVKRVNLCALDTGSLTLGYVGENDHTQIRINCASVFADYPSAVVSMTVKAPSGVVYPREVETDGQIVIWTITDSDTASAGNGQIQLTFTEDGTIVKTVIAVTTVRASIVGDNPPPDPITDWIDEAGEALAKLEGMTASATQLPAGEDPTAEVEVVDGHYNIALGIPGGDTESIIDDTAGVGDTTKVWSANKSATDLSELKSDIDSKAPAIYQTASGDIVTFADGADNMPLKECVVSIDPVQSGTGDPSPTNVRPITGHTGTTVTRTGVNMCDPATLQTGKVLIDTNIVVGNEVVLSDSSATNVFAKACRVEKGKKYVFSYDASGTQASTQARTGCICDENDIVLEKFVSWHPVLYPIVITPSHTGYLWLGVDKNSKDFQIQLGETASQYVPYVSSTYLPISWQTAAGTVYKGVVDMVTEKLTVTHEIVDLGDFTWTYRTGFFSSSTLSGYKRSSSNTIVPDILSTCYKASTIATVTSPLDMRVTVGRPNNWDGCILVSDSRYTDGAELKTAITGQKLVYPLATPVVYNLSDLPTVTVLKESNIWADCGGISVTYPADTKTYIAEMTDPDGNVIQVSGSTPSITGESGKRYICGTVDSISITPPQTGIVDVVFTSGTTPTVLTVPNTVRFPAWFDSTSLDASTVYEINIQDGFGAVSKWT